MHWLKHHLLCQTSAFTSCHAKCPGAIEEVIKGFEISAAHLRTAGVDGAEIVASDGYLLRQFLNPCVNLRADAYGGFFENRLRLLCAVIAATRKGADEDMVVGIRLSGEKKGDDGIEQDDMIARATALSSEPGLDYPNVTAGTPAGLAGSTHMVSSTMFEVGDTAPLAAAIKVRVSIAVFVAGRINQPPIAEKVLAAGQADICGMTRALIPDPQMPAKAPAQFPASSPQKRYGSGCLAPARLR